jgi:hypothetical protein
LNSEEDFKTVTDEYLNGDGRVHRLNGHSKSPSPNSKIAIAHNPKKVALFDERVKVGEI